ncbi:purine permease [Henriciella mobilis]|uniref:uracil-xanthine permease family protein n=1 Tax=Henriciella mobilis TaxID=2305467 RepID=UPI000E671E72|nr:nucleobase:cation symporter-2 family protein [Henriciella mobilis]RIJ16889.1 purine permease [Henriciella mobilis]RIJ19331.1 purine permease [Henriciella mobilis]
MSAGSTERTEKSSGSILMTREQRQDPDYFPGFAAAIPLSIQHILAMFISNVTPAIIVAGAAGFGFGSPDVSALLYMIQMSMLFAGLATLLQTIGMGPVGSRLPIVQGTSFAFLPIMIPLVAGQGVEAMAVLTTGALFGGLFHAGLSVFVKRLRFAFPPLVTGLVVAMIALSLLQVGIQYAAGGVPLRGSDDYGSWQSWLLASIVIVATFGFKFFTKGMWSSASVLLGLLVGYGVAFAMGRVDLQDVSTAGWVSVPVPFHFGFSFSVSAVIGFCLMGIVSAIETVGDVSAIAEGGAGREAKDDELSGATLADGVGTSLAAIFGGLPNTSFSQNVGLIAMTGIMSRHIVSLGAVFLIICGLLPKVGAFIITIPIEVLGGGVIIMFGMVASAAISILSNVQWSQRNMLIFALSLSLGFGLQLEPQALQHVPEDVRMFLTSGLLPATFLAVLLNLVLPELEEDVA